MRIVRESIEFKRGQSIYRALWVGSRAVIKDWFAEFAPNAKYTIDDNLNISVGGSLFLRDTKITSLPDNLSVGGDLDLRETNLASLPDNLSIGGSLNLWGTNITSLPDNLSIGGKIYKDF